MNTIQIKENLKFCENPSEYDRLTQSLAEAEKAEALEQGRKNLEGLQAAQAAQAAAVKQLAEDKADLDDLYKQIRETDEQLYTATRDLVEGALKRLELSQRAISIEGQIISQSEKMKMPYERRKINLYGGKPVTNKLHDFLKTWLQRYLDWRERLEKSPDLENLSLYGLQGGGVHADFPGRF